MITFNAPLLNAFMLDWLKQYLNYPFDIENIVSVQISKEKNGIHLDSKEHAILEHCFNSDGKLVKTTLIIMLLLDLMQNT